MKNAVLLLTIFFQSLISFSQTKQFLIPYRNGKQWGFCDTLGKVIIQPKWDSSSFLQTYTSINSSRGKIFSGKKQGIIAFDGKLILSPQFDNIEELAGGYKVTIKNKIGFYNAAGKMLLAAKYDEMDVADYGTSNFLKLMQGIKFGLYAVSGKIQVPAVYDLVTDDLFSGDIDAQKYFFAKKGNEKFLISKQTGRATKYTGEYDPENEGLIEAPISMEMEGETKPDQRRMQEIREQFHMDEVVPFPLTSQYSEGETVYKIKRNGKTGLAFGDRFALLFPNYDSIGYGIRLPFEDIYLKTKSSYLFAAKKGNFFGLINEAAQQVLPFKYENIQGASNNITAFLLTLNGKKGIFMAYTFYPVIEPQYDALEYYGALNVSEQWSFALLKVTKNGKPGFVGENGKEYFKN